MYIVYKAPRRLVHDVHPRQTQRRLYAEGKSKDAVTGGLYRCAHNGSSIRKLD
jgi:hypothetical protein